MAELHTGATITPSKLELLTGWMGEQRWYTGKGRTPELTRLFSWRLGDPAGEVGIETMVVQDTSGEQPVTYQVPLTYRSAPLLGAEAALIGTAEHSVLGTRYVYDGAHDPVYATQLLELIEGRAHAESASEADTVEEGVEGQPSATRDYDVRVRTARVVTGEQSNTSIVCFCADDAGAMRPVVIKVFRMLQDGPNPDVVLQTMLRSAGCERVPDVIGSVQGTWPTGVGERTAYTHFAFAQEFLPNCEDAWSLAIQAAQKGVPFTAEAAGIGAATAEVHRTLAEAMGQRPVQTGRTNAAETLVGEFRERYAAAAAQVPELAEHEAGVRAAYERALAAHWPDLQRIHGDFHLGQVLSSPERGWVLLDFEGEPLRPLRERSKPDQALRDVAGMLRSLDYAGGHVEQAGGASAREWVSAARGAFLDGYAAQAGRDPREHAALLAAFELDKAMYEVVYESRNRPTWVGIPLAAVARLAEGLGAPTTDQEAEQ